MGLIGSYSRTSCACLLLAVLASAGCHVDRPIHPLRLEGFPGAEVEPGLFPLREGMEWTFQDRLHPDAPPLSLKLKKERRRFYLEGTKRGERLEIAYADGFLEVRQGDQVVDRPLKFPGKAGDTWQVNDAVVTIFGYDEIDVLGEEKRALVVAVDRRQFRDLAWFVQDMGWVRLRTEKRGRALRDAVLVAYEPGRMN
jgi:PAS domain-containing protein